MSDLDLAALRRMVDDGDWPLDVNALVAEVLPALLAAAEERDRLRDERDRLRELAYLVPPRHDADGVTWKEKAAGETVLREATDVRLFGARHSVEFLTDRLKEVEARLTEAENERDILKCVIESKHGGESLALLDELDDARAALREAEGALSVYDFRYESERSRYKRNAAIARVREALGGSDG